MTSGRYGAINFPSTESEQSQKNVYLSLKLNLIIDYE